MDSPLQFSAKRGVCGAVGDALELTTNDRRVDWDASIVASERSMLLFAGQLSVGQEWRFGSLR
ncbi:hypothetical protein C464_16267 [Halorubrum coriense DSM 10284]|uniref:Uncharacterized protein n=1 Tax=Halorubrum coriense DSM 10284 TaxID=1227466 RepID=M0E7C7_9EURY|nr:hypothetical protein C464_16267 [Halorubrum coriense DSM 10284]